LRCGTNQEYIGNKKLVHRTNHNYKRMNKNYLCGTNINFEGKKIRPRKKSRLRGIKNYSTEQIVTTKKEHKIIIRGTNHDYRGRKNCDAEQIKTA
jgi:hypothetical protein